MEEERKLNANVVKELVENHKHVGLRMKRIDPVKGTFDPRDSVLRHEIVAMIVDYLREQGYHSSMVTLQDEANVKLFEESGRRLRVQRIRKAVVSGDWAEVEKLFAKHTFPNHKSLLFAIHRQQFLEMIERQESQKAFAFLNKRLKPLEGLVSVSEFADLCYLLTRKSVQEVASLRDWPGISSSRKALARQFETLQHAEVDYRPEVVRVEPPRNRLQTLLQQAVAYQMEFSRYHPRLQPHVRTLLSDYECFIIPNAPHVTFRGHVGNIKCLEFMWEGLHLLSGGSDNTLRLWDTETGTCLAQLVGHTARVWDVATAQSGSMAVSASGDATVKVWQLADHTPQPNKEDPQRAVVQEASTLRGHKGDVYSLQVAPSSQHACSGGYDHTVRLWDLETGQSIRVLTGHEASVSSTVFNSVGNLIVSGSKDRRIKFWDVLSGVCVNTFSSHLGEVTSVSMGGGGKLLLSSSKDNANRLWDVRLSRPVKKFKGHQNTSKNFVRSAFGPHDAVIIGGSEDGCVYLWDTATGDLLHRLCGHHDVVYDVKYSAKAALFASCSNDETVRTWWYNDQIPFGRGTVDCT